MYKLIANSAMPKWLKWLLYIVLAITCVYWIILGIYRLLDLIRLIIHWLTEINHYWEFMMCLFVLGLGSFLIAQFALGLDPWGKFIGWLSNCFNIIS